PRLAGARRPLDEEIARVERSGPLALLAKIRRLERAAEAVGQPRPRPGEDVFERAVSTIARADRGAQARKRASLRVRLVGPRRDQRCRKRLGREPGPAAENEHALHLVHFHDRAGALPRYRIDGRVAGPELVLLGREAEAVVQRAPHASRRILRLQPADRLAVLHQLVERHLAAREEPPPGRAGLAPVVLEQLGGQPARRPGALAREQRLAQLLTLGVGLLLVVVDQPRVRTLRPRPATG